MRRAILPARRECETFCIAFAGEKYHVTVGFYPDGSVGEIFINRVKDKMAARLGEQLDAVCRDSAILLSLALQHGTSLETMEHAITRDGDGGPQTVVGAIIDAMRK